MFFNETATTMFSTLSLHDALPIYQRQTHDRLGRRDGEDQEHRGQRFGVGEEAGVIDDRDVDGADHELETEQHRDELADRKSTRLNSSHVSISYAVFCFKTKKQLSF